MFSTQKPWSSLTSADMNTTDFPCLKHFWPLEDNTFKDIIGGVIPAITSIVANGSYAWDIVTTPATDIVAGTLGVSRNVQLLFCTSNFGATGADANMLVGDNTNSLGLNSWTGVFDGASVESLDTRILTTANLTNANEVRLRAALVDWAADNIYAIDILADGTYTKSAGESTATLTPISQLGQRVSLGVGTTETYMMGVLEFDVVPSDAEIKSGLTWMHNASQNGQKVVYPGWKNRV